MANVPPTPLSLAHLGSDPNLSWLCLTASEMESKMAVSTGLAQFG